MDQVKLIQGQAEDGFKSCGPWVEGSVGLTRLAFVAQAVGVALDVEDGGAMEEAVQDGAGHGGVLAEDLVPVAKGFVAGEDDGPLLLVALADDLEEKAGLQMIEFEVADFVDDEELGPGEVVQLAVEAVFVHGFAQPAGQIGDGGEVNAVAHLAGEHAQRDGQMGFADAGRAEEDEVAAFAQVAAGGQFFDEPPVDGGLRRVIKVFEPFQGRELCELEVDLDGLAMTFGDFAVEQMAEEVAVGPALGTGLLGGGVEMGTRGEQAVISRVETTHFSRVQNHPP